MKPIIDLTGQRFGRLLVISRAPNKGGRTAWNCSCDCGKEKIVQSYHLKIGDIVSCGCYQKEMSREAHTTHGLSNTTIYRRYRGMVGRCYNENHKDYKNYGDRGIRVCDEWLGENGFIRYLDYILTLPHAANFDDNWKRTDDRSLDRINNDGNYEYGNLRWATPTQQANNRRSCKKAQGP